MQTQQPKTTKRRSLMASAVSTDEHKRKSRSTTPPHVEPILTSIAGTKVMTGLGGTSIWGFIKDGELRTVKLGRRTMVVVSSIHQMIARRQA
jgi:predicted DNA-binding transcriptional regulator AlpA